MVSALGRFNVYPRLLARLELARYDAIAHRADRSIVDQLADHRVIGGYQGSKSREVLMNLPDVDELLERLGLE